MKYYIRTTHDFDNKKREWIYRAYPEWDMSFVKNRESHYTCGIHVFDRDRWLNINELVKLSAEWIKSDDEDRYNKIRSIPKWEDFLKEEILKDIEFYEYFEMIQSKEIL